MLRYNLTENSLLFSPAFLTRLRRARSPISRWDRFDRSAQSVFLYQNITISVHVFRGFRHFFCLEKNAIHVYLLVYCGRYLNSTRKRLSFGTFMLGSACKTSRRDRQLNFSPSPGTHSHSPGFENHFLFALIYVRSCAFAQIFSKKLVFLFRNKVEGVLSDAFKARIRSELSSSFSLFFPGFGSWGNFEIKILFRNDFQRSDGSRCRRPTGGLWRMDGGRRWPCHNSPVSHPFSFLLLLLLLLSSSFFFFFFFLLLLLFRSTNHFHSILHPFLKAPGWNRRLEPFISRKAFCHDAALPGVW